MFQELEMKEARRQAELNRQFAADLDKMRQKTQEAVKRIYARKDKEIMRQQEIRARQKALADARQRKVRVEEKGAQDRRAAVGQTAGSSRGERKSGEGSSSGSPRESGSISKGKSRETGKTA